VTKPSPTFTLIHEYGTRRASITSTCIGSTKHAAAALGIDESLDRDERRC
jgi:hypothetical protein